MPLTARPATVADAPLLFDWRNDLDTVAASVEQHKVGVAEHGWWLSGALTNPAVRLMVVESVFPYLQGRVPVATYRLEGVGSPVVVLSLTVAPVHRGLRIGTDVIVLGSRHAFHEGARRVAAVVRSENARSRKAFARAGFHATTPIRAENEFVPLFVDKEALVG